MPLERIIITFEKTGEFRGASATDFDGQPVHLEPADLAGKVATLNAAAVARLAVVDAEIAAKDNALAAIESAITADDLDAAKAEVAKTKQTARQKERAELQAQRKQLDDRIAALKD